MIDNPDAAIAIGGGVGAAITAGAFIFARLYRGRNGNGKAHEVYAVRRELHERVTDEVSAVGEQFVRKEVCSVVSANLQKDVKEIKEDVKTLLARTGGG